MENFSSNKAYFNQNIPRNVLHSHASLVGDASRRKLCTSERRCSRESSGRGSDKEDTGGKSKNRLHFPDWFLVSVWELRYAMYGRSRELDSKANYGK